MLSQSAALHSQVLSMLNQNQLNKSSGQHPLRKASHPESRAGSSTKHQNPKHA